MLIKIDTEGYEPIILEAILDFCKHSITNGNAVVVQNFIIEVTSKSWASFDVHTYTYTCYLNYYTVHTYIAIMLM